MKESSIVSPSIVLSRVTVRRAVGSEAVYCASVSSPRAKMSFTKFLTIVILILIFQSCPSYGIGLNRSSEVNSLYEKLSGVNEGVPNSAALEVRTRWNETYVKIDGREVYRYNRNKSAEFDHGTGIHLLLLHQKSFKVLSKELFFTAQPSSDKHLLRRLLSVHQGRIVVLVGSANFTFWFRKVAEDFFYESGSLLGPRVAIGEPWALVFRMGLSTWRGYELNDDYWDEDTNNDDTLANIKALNKVKKRGRSKFGAKEKDRNSWRRKKLSKNVSPVYFNDNFSRNGQSHSTEPDFLDKFEILFEGITTIKNYTRSLAPSLGFHLELQPRNERRCPWHDNEELRDLRSFCSLYDGYKPFCKCEDRVPLLPKYGEGLDSDYGVIPVGIVAAKRFPQVLRQVRQLRGAKGGRDVLILLCVDGFSSEAHHLASLLNLPVIFHDNKYKKGTRDRVNEHVGWSLKKLQKRHPKAEYLILLEDDLDLAPDFMRYFQQLAWLMDVDNTIIVANAYNYNAFPHTALDSSKIYLVQSYPYYGWMVRKKDALKMLQQWPKPENKADWDLYMHYYYLNNSYVIIPEVPRTKHVGGGGVHVSGFVQETTYNVRPINKDPNVQLNLRRQWSKAYGVDLMKFALTATVLNITSSPCATQLLTMEKPGGKFVLYLNLSGDGDEAFAYETVAQCFGFYEENMQEQFEGTLMKKYFYNEVLLVACPVSPYCHIGERSPSIYTPSVSHIKDADETPFVTMYSEVVNLRRIEPGLPNTSEEENLTNVRSFILTINE